MTIKLDKVRIRQDNNLTPKGLKGGLVIKYFFKPILKIIPPKLTIYEDFKERKFSALADEFKMNPKTFSLMLHSQLNYHVLSDTPLEELFTFV